MLKDTLKFLLLVISLPVFGQTFKTTTDTIEISLAKLINPAAKVELTHAIKFKNRFYCFFEERRKDNIRRDLKFCFAFSIDGKNLRKIEVPKEIQNTFYYDLFVKHDTIFIKKYMDNSTFYFNISKAQWIKTKEADDMIFEDYLFYFTYLDFGEWGSTTWCRDKQTGKEYELASSGTTVNKINSVYYITSGVKVLRIRDPLKMKQSERDYYYESVRQKKHSEGTISLEGAEIIFDDTTFSYWDQQKPKLVIGTSFVVDNNLYYLCTDSTKTFISKLQNNRMVPLQSVGEKLSVFDWHYSYRNKIQKSGYQLLKFNTANLFGLIEIIRNEICVHYFRLK